MSVQHSTPAGVACWRPSLAVLLAAQASVSDPWMNAPSHGAAPSASGCANATISTQLALSFSRRSWLNTCRRGEKKRGAQGGALLQRQRQLQGSPMQL